MNLRRHQCRGRLIAALTLLVCMVPMAAQASWLELRGDSAESAVSLIWMPTEAWPANVAGIEVLRAPASAEGAPAGPWVATTEAMIRPSVERERLWGDVHPEGAVQTYLRAQLSGDLAAGKLQYIEDEPFMAMLRGMDGPTARALRGMLTTRNEAAWMLGFGTVRGRPVGEAGQLYGLFEVSLQGVRAAQPVAVFRDVYVADDDPQLAVTPTFEYAYPNGVQMTWTFPAELYDALNLRPFGVSKEVLNADGEVEVVSLGHALMEREGDVVTWRFAHSKSDREEAHTFHITTRSFVTRDRQTSVVKYDPDETREREAAGHPMKSPKILEAKQLQTGELAITWEFDIGHEQYITGFELHRKDDATGKFVAIQTDLSPTTRQALDPSDKVQGETYSYKVVAFRREDRMAYGSQIVPVLITDMRPPPSPKDVKAVVEVAGGERAVVLTWADKAPGDKLTHRWVLDVDHTSPGKVRRQSSIAPLEVPTYRYPIETIEARPYTFRVVAISPSGVESDPVEVRAEPPGKHLPDVRLDRFDLIDSGSRLRLRWTYPRLENLAGFHLFIDGEEVLKPDTLGPEARSWESEKLQPGSNHRYNLQAVSTGGLRSRFGADWTYRMPAGAGLPVRPSKLQVREDRAARQLRVFWARVADGLTREYVVRVKAPGGSWRDAGTVSVAKPPLWVQTRVEAAGTWEFEVVGRTVHGLVGPAGTIAHEVAPREEAAATQPAEPTAPPARTSSVPAWLWWLVGLALLGSAAFALRRKG